MKGLRGLGCAVGLVVAVLFAVFGLGLAFVVELPLRLALGWILFLRRVVPEVTWRPAEILSALVVLVLVAVGLQAFLARHASPKPWRWRWTLGGLGLVVAMFATSIASAGIAHQAAWLVRSRPFLESSWASLYLKNQGRGLIERAYGSPSAVADADIGPILAQDPDVRRLHARFHVVPLTGGRVAVFHRDPAERAAAGVIVFSDEDRTSGEWRPAGELGSVLLEARLPG